MKVASWVSLSVVRLAEAPIVMPKIRKPPPAEVVSLMCFVMAVANESLTVIS